MRSFTPRLQLRWVMVALPVLIVSGSIVWALISVTLVAAAGSQRGDFLFPIREQALELQLNLASDPQERSEIELRLSETPLPDAAAPAKVGNEPVGSAAATATIAVTEDRSTQGPGAASLAPTTEAPDTPEPAQPSHTPSEDPGSGRGPSASNTPEPTRTSKPADSVEATRTHEPTKTTEPARTQEPTRTPEPTRTQEPSQTPADNSGSGSGGSGSALTETPRPNDVTIQGTLESIGGVWVVAGQVFQVNGTTEIRGNPQVGSHVEVRAWRSWDGTAVAYRIEEK